MSKDRMTLSSGNALKLRTGTNKTLSCSEESLGFTWYVGAQEVSNYVDVAAFLSSHWNDRCMIRHSALGALGKRLHKLLYL